MEAHMWAGPPPMAAQPMGIQSTAGAVPVMNEKGEVSMKKVKVQRYISGKRPEYAPGSSDEEEDEDFTAPKLSALQGSTSPHRQSQLTETELSDPRLRRLLGQRQSGGPRRRMAQAEVIEESEDDKSDANASDMEASKQSESESDSDAEEAEVDEDALALRRQKLRERAMAKTQREEEVLNKEEEGSDDSSEEESSEYSEETDSEEEGPRMKPVFVKKKDRLTMQQKENLEQTTKQSQSEARRRAEERRREMLRFIENENRTTAPPAAGGDSNSFRPDGTLIGVGGELKHDNVSTNARLEDINTDDEADDVEYDNWKLRELRRRKRDKEEQEAMQKEKEESEKLRTMTDEERRIEQRMNPKVITNKSAKGKYKFLQKYYHRGAFFLDKDEDVYKRDFSESTLDDHFDKGILPKVMQVKNFGRSGRTKYTHLVDQDTTTFDSPWATDTQINNKFISGAAGGMKQVFESTSLNKPKSSSRKKD